MQLKSQAEQESELHSVISTAGLCRFCREHSSSKLEMGKCQGLCRFWRSKGNSSDMITSQTPCDDDEHQPSTSDASVSHSLDSFRTMDLRDLCEQIFVLLQIIEDEGQENVKQTLRSRGRPFWQRLTCLPILQELFKREKPNHSILEPFFGKGENDPNTLAYMIFRDVPCDVRIAVGLLSVGASLENWADISQLMKEACLSVFQQMCGLGKLLNELRNPITANLNLKQKLQQELQKGPELLMEGSIICAFHVNGSYLKSYLQGCSYKESLMWFSSKMKSMYKALCSWSDSLIFLGVRSPPLLGRPDMNYPDHAVGIEKEKHDIIKMLEWGNQRKTVAVIVRGEAGIGKTTVADAVFTSIHIPLCNYIRYTWFDQGNKIDNDEVYVKKEEWIRYFWKKTETEKVDDENSVENSENLNDGDDESYQESEAAKDKEHDDDEEFQHEHFVRDHDYVVRHANDLMDLIFLESKANAALNICSFIYFDNPTQNLSKNLRYILSEFETKKQRIVVTTRDVEYAWDECKKVLSEDCMYNYIMLTPDEPAVQLSKEKEIVTTRSRKTMQELDEIARSSMGVRAWQMLLASASSHCQHHDDNDIPQVIRRIIEFCRGIPERLPVVCRYIAAAQGCPHSALRQLLNISSSGQNDDDAVKWEKFINLLVSEEDFSEGKNINDLQLICYFRHYCYSCLPARWVSWGCMAGLTRDVVEEQVLRILQEKGMLLPDGRGSVRIPYPLCRYFIVTRANHHFYAYVDSDGAGRAMLEEYQQQTAEEIKALAIGGMTELSPDMMPKNLRLLWIPETTCLSTVPAETPSNKLSVYAGGSFTSFPLHMAPFIRFMVLILPYSYSPEDSNQEIPLGLGLRYLHLQVLRNHFEMPWERIARLSNLRALTLSLYMDDVKVPVEFCVLAAISNTIRELHINSKGLSELPQNFGQLRCLHILHLEGAKLRRLPEGFGMLSSLRELWFDWCREMEELCSDFSNLGSLHTLGWIRNYLLPEKCWKEMVKLKRLTTLLLDADLHDESKTLPFPQRVSIYYVK